MMDEKLQISVSVEKDEQTFTFLLPYGFKYGAAYDALFEMLDMVSKRSQEQSDRAKKQLAAAKAAADAETQPKVEAVQEKK